MKSYWKPENRRKCKQENVLQSYYDDEKSRDENPASWVNAIFWMRNWKTKKNDYDMLKTIEYDEK